MEAFEKELTTLINRHSIENVVDMPDFILAGMICRMIEAMGPSIKKTMDWHGCDSVCHPTPNAGVSIPGGEPGYSPRECYAIFHGEGGYQAEREQALRTFEIGKKYRIIGGRAGQSSTTLVFEGVQGSWNSVLFHYDASVAPVENLYRRHNRRA